MKARDYVNLIYSPGWGSSLLHYFISGAMAQKGLLKFEAIYLALPFLQDERIMKVLANSNSRSHFDSIFDSVDKRNLLVGINEKIQNCVPISNEALILLSNIIELNISDFITTDNVLNYSHCEDESLRREFKAAFNWGGICSRAEVLFLFSRLGVKKV